MQASLSTLPRRTTRKGRAVGLLNNIEPIPDEDSTDAIARRRVKVTLDVGRNVVVVLVLIGLIVGIVVLYSSNNDAQARVLVDILIGVLSGTLGVNIGERSGAQNATQGLAGR